jgi:hypothetical protein
MGGDQVRGERTLCFVRKEVIHLRGCAIVSDDVETFIIHIENKILAL